MEDEDTQTSSQYENVEYLEDSQDVKPSTSKCKVPEISKKTTFTSNWSEEEEEEKEEKEEPVQDLFEFRPPTPEKKKNTLPRRMRAKVRKTRNSKFQKPLDFFLHNFFF